MSCFQIKSSVSKVAVKSLNTFEEFQVSVKLQAFIFTKNDIHYSVFIQGVLKLDLETLSHLKWSFFVAVVQHWKSSIFAKASNFYAAGLLDPTPLFSCICKQQNGPIPAKTF